MPAPRTDLISALAHGLDPVLFCRERLQLDPDAWQARLLRSTARQCILNCGRQTGKSTVVAALALHTALYKAGALVLIIAPSQRQSRELFLKIQAFLECLEPAEPTEEETKLTLMLRNGSRVVTLPGDNPRTVRGYSAPALIIEDEAAFVADDTFDALLPMLAASPDGRIVLMSTPYVSAGHFYAIWNSDGDWERYEQPTSSCPRVTAQWLEARRHDNPLRFNREYECQFGSPDDSLFTSDMIDRMVVNDFEPLHI
jgi:Terminase large subunit, T4likevirus-type, N-terminal